MVKKAEITDEFIRQSSEAGKQYCLRLYRKGPNRDQPPEEVDRIQMEHLRYLFGLRADGMIVINGPVIDESGLSGMAIFNTTDKEEVRRLSDGDPAVKAGRVVYEVYHWYGLPGDSLPA